LAPRVVIMKDADLLDDLPHAVEMGLIGHELMPNWVLRDCHHEGTRCTDGRFRPGQLPRSPGSAPHGCTGGTLWMVLAKRRRET